MIHGTRCLSDCGKRERIDPGLCLDGETWDISWKKLNFNCPLNNEFFMKKQGMISSQVEKNHKSSVGYKEGAVHISGV